MTPERKRNAQNYSTDCHDTIPDNEAAVGCDKLLSADTLQARRTMTLKTVWRTIEKRKLLTAGQTVIAAVSGGADSVALLHILARLAPHLGIRLHAASLHHGIRGQAAQDDVDFVQQIAEQWQIPCTLGRADVPRLAREAGIGIEAAARRARYDFLARAAAQENSACIAAAHHADDQAETILMHIIRGSGRRGLMGMQFAAPMPGHAHITLIRPLLEMTRGDLEGYCAAHELDFRHDGSNDDIRYRRNFIRREVMSRLQALNPNAAAAFGRLADSAAVDEDYIASQFEAAVMPMVDARDDGWSLSREAYARLHPAMRRRLLREAFRQLGGGGSTLNHKNTLELVGWAKTARTGARRDLGRAIQLRMGYEDVCIERQSAAALDDDYRLIDAETTIALAASCDIAIGRLRIRAVSEQESDAGGAGVWLPSDAALCLRTRRTGERFRPKGMGGRSRKIKDWMIDRKIPRSIRSQIPMVSANGEVIAICLGDTWHLADLSAFKVDEGSGICLILD